jgi:branched-chain amino acid aminotransferase
MLEFALSPSTSRLPDDERTAVLAAPGFGKHFTDHMVVATWSAADGWHDAQVRPYGPLQLDPSAAVLHYAQEIFEGLKAYRHDDGSVWAFRPERNAARFQRSARRLALPELSAEDFLEAVRSLVAVDIDWVPPAAGGEASLYLRPFMFASEAFLGVRPAAQVTFCIIASPAGPYFSGGLTPVSIWLSTQYTRAAPGGTGAAKCGGNYAASLAAQVEASTRGCDQVCFLDAVERRWVEELGGMNLYFVMDDGSVVTPELTGTILEGVTRDSIMTLLDDQGHKVVERRIAADEWREAAASGAIREVFACGTAAVVTPVGRLVDAAGETTMGDGGTGEVTAAVRAALLDVQYGRVADDHGWMHRLA